MAKLIPRGQSESGTEIFELEYAPPFGGVDSSAAAPYIDPKNFVDLNGMLIADNSLNAVSLDVMWTQGYSGTSRSGFRPVGAFKIDTIIYEIWAKIPGLLGGIVGAVQVWWNAVNSVSPFQFFGQQACNWDSSVNLTGFFQTTSAFHAGDIVSHKTINDSTYFSLLGCGTIFKIGPNRAGSPTLTILTNYVGGAFLDELNGRLICGCTTKTDPLFPTTLINSFPYQLAWSAEQNYGQWNPVSGGVVTGAGYNNIPDIDEVMTGIFTIGPNAYLLRANGISEISPLNSGIEPFAFNHLWSSEFGMGTMFSNAIGKYGSACIFIATDDLISMGYEGIKDISGVAKTFIYTNLLLTSVLTGAQFPLLSGVLTPQVVNNAMYLYYIVGTPDTPNNIYSMLFYNVDNQMWSRLLVPMPGLSTSTVHVISMFSGSADTLFGMSNLVPATFLATYNSSTDRSTYYFVNAQTPNGSGFAKFPANDIMFYNDITIDSVLMYIEATGVGSVNLDVNGVPFTTINTPAGHSANIYKSYPFNGLDVSNGLTYNGQPYTGRQPQLSILITKTISVGKASMFGSYDPKQKNI